LSSVGNGVLTQARPSELDHRCPGQSELNNWAHSKRAQAWAMGKQARAWAATPPRGAIRPAVQSPAGGRPPHGKLPRHPPRAPPKHGAQKAPPNWGSCPPKKTAPMGRRSRLGFGPPRLSPPQARFGPPTPSGVRPRHGHAPRRPLGAPPLHAGGRGVPRGHPGSAKSITGHFWRSSPLGIGATPPPEPP